MPGEAWPALAEVYDDVEADKDPWKETTEVLATAAAVSLGAAIVVVETYRGAQGKRLNAAKILTTPTPSAAEIRREKLEELPSSDEEGWRAERRGWI